MQDATNFSFQSADRRSDRTNPRDAHRHRVHPIDSPRG
jgi:hypothetical protein